MASPILRAAIYARKSTTSEPVADTEKSVARQIEHATAYARTKGWELGRVSVDVDYDHRAVPRRFELQIRVGGDLSDAQLARLEKVARSCPLRRSIEAGIEFEETIALHARDPRPRPVPAGGAS